MHGRSLLRALRFVSLVSFLLIVSLIGSYATGAEELPEVRNIIYIIGDGTSFVQLEVGRIMKEGPLAMDSMEVQSSTRNASLNNPVTDSAASGTAHATGERTNNRMVSMRPDGSHIPTIVEMAQDAGLSTGVVTNDALYGATPAVYVAHAADRGEYETIIEQAVFQTEPDVFLGGAMITFVEIGGPARLGQTNYELVINRDQLLAWDPTSEKKLLGFFDSKKMDYAIDRSPTQPTLAEMAQTALDVLSARDTGFFLMIEDDRMDTASHNNDLRRLAYQNASLDEAVATALAFAEENPDTLVVVTADHETGGLTRGAGTITKESLLASFDRPDPGEAITLITNILELNPEADVVELIEKYAGVRIDPEDIPDGPITESLESLLAAGTFYYTRTGHSDAPVPMYAQGPGAERFADLEHIANAGQTVIELLNLK